MRVKKNPLSAIDTLSILEKYWIDVHDIKAIACVGDDRAKKIKREVVKKCESENMKLPYGLVPSEKVVEYLEINIKYLKQCANYIEKKTPPIKK